MQFERRSYFLNVWKGTRKESEVAGRERETEKDRNSTESTKMAKWSLVCFICVFLVIFFEETFALAQSKLTSFTYCSALTRKLQSYVLRGPKKLYGVDGEKN